MGFIERATPFRQRRGPNNFDRGGRSTTAPYRRWLLTVRLKLPHRGRDQTVSGGGTETPAELPVL